MNRASTLVGGVSALLLLGATVARAQQPLTDRDRDIIDAYEVMQGVTMGLMGATATLGLVQLYNMPTSFSDGACASGNALFGSYACTGELSLVHGVMGIATIAAYTATGALALAAPDLDQDSEDTVTDLLGVMHGVGIGLTGTLGLLAANPGLLGLSGSAAADFSRHLRVIHWGVALVTTAAFATHLVVDHVGGPL